MCLERASCRFFSVLGVIKVVLRAILSNRKSVQSVSQDLSHKVVTFLSKRAISQHSSVRKCCSIIDSDCSIVREMV